MLRSQLHQFFPGPSTIPDRDDGYAESDDEADEAVRIDDVWEKARIGQRGYDMRGRRGGVWIRKPRSSRPGSAGQSPSRRPLEFLRR